MRWITPALLLCVVQVSGAADRVPATAPATTKPVLDLSSVIAPHSRIELDVPYVAGGGPEQSLDVYAPKNASAAPIILYLHGGEWAKRDKQEGAYKPRFLNSNGIIFISANYRLSGTAKHPAQVNDVAAAIKWALDHAAEYGGDPKKIYLMGHSAGCHLATLVGLDARPLATVGMKPTDLAGVISWSGGAFDLVEKHDAGGMYSGYIEQCFGMDRAVWADASPMNHVGQTAMPRFLLVSAERDNASSIEANHKLADKIKAAGGTATTALLMNKDHGLADHDLGLPDDQGNDVLLTFVQDN